MTFLMSVAAGFGAVTTDSLRALQSDKTTIAEQRLRKLDALVTRWRSAHSRDPDDPIVRRNLVGALNTRAKAVCDAGRFDEAERDFFDALFFAPDDEQTIANFAASLNNRALAMMRERRLDEARALFKRALDYLPRVTDTEVTNQIKINYSNFLAAEGDAFAVAQQMEQARARYTEALTYDPRNADALAALAGLDYDSDDYAAALEGYEKTLAVAADPVHAGLRLMIEERVETLRKEMALEADFITIHDQSGRFRLFFPKDFPKGTVVRLLETLNEAHGKVGRDLDFHTSLTLTVKVYSRAQLGAIQQTPQWVGSFFDGKIRLLDERLLGSPAQLRQSIFHEYTHALVHFRAGEAVPSWLHEGLAQIEAADGRTAARDVHYLASRLRTRKTVSLAELAGPIERRSAADQMPLIYLQSKSLVEFLLQEGGWEKIRQLLSETARLGDFEAAFSAAYGMTTEKLESEWKRWLLDRDEKEK